MDEYKIRELASYMEAYYKQEAHPDYSAEGLFTALSWAWDWDEVAVVWSARDVESRALEEFDLELSNADIREILVELEEADADYGTLDYCIQKWAWNRDKKEEAK